MSARFLAVQKEFLDRFLHLSLRTQTALYILATTHKSQSTRILGCDLSHPFTSLSTTLFSEIKLLNKHTRHLWNFQTARKVSAYYLGLVTHAHKIVMLKDWHEFIGKVTFHASKVTRHHEAKVLPSWNALVNHSLRATYVLQLALSLPFQQCAALHLCANYGWTRSSNGAIEIAWNTSATTVEQVGCKCSSGCSSTRCTCYSKSKECTARCSCRECINFNILVAQT